ncbi:MAG: hypothetical protein ABJZ69_12310, partial [Hyphomicrobiales bacterium]
CCSFDAYFSVGLSVVFAMTVVSSPITAGLVSRPLVHYVANAHRELEGAMTWEDIIDAGVVYPNGGGRCIQVFYSSATLVITC